MILGSGQLGGLSAQLGGVSWTLSSSVGDPRIIDVAGSYQFLIDVAGSYQPTIDLSGSYQPMIDAAGSVEDDT